MEVRDPFVSLDLTILWVGQLTSLSWLICILSSCRLNGSLLRNSGSVSGPPFSAQKDMDFWGAFSIYKVDWSTFHSHQNLGHLSLDKNSEASIFLLICAVFTYIIQNGCPLSLLVMGSLILAIPGECSMYYVYNAILGHHFLSGISSSFSHFHTVANPSVSGVKNVNANVSL